MMFGTRNIAEPIMVPTTMLVESNNPSRRGSSRRTSIAVGALISMPNRRAALYRLGRVAAMGECVPPRRQRRRTFRIRA